MAASVNTDINGLAPIIGVPAYLNKYYNLLTTRKANYKI